MAEPPKKRARRPDSTQMWDASDRRAPISSRERDEPPRERKDDRDRRDYGDKDRDRRRYRSRSPRDSRDARGGRDRDRERGGRDPRDTKDSRGSGRGYDDKDREGRRDRDDDRKGKDRGRDRRDRDVGKDSMDKPRERSRSRDNDRRRSRSPRKELERESGSRRERKAKSVPKPEEEFTKSRTATPPVSFRVKGQDHDRMDTDTDDHKQMHENGVNETVEEGPIDYDDDIVIEDDSMAAMQAMMGFGGFGTTHQKKVAGNNVGAVRKEKKTEYRQYMNRQGGFNRPLSPTRE